MHSLLSFALFPARSSGSHSGHRVRSAHCRVHSLHPIVIRAAAALGWNPGNDLIGILNVASLAVHAVRGIQADALAMGRGFVVHHLVDVRGAEILAGAAELFHAPVVTDVGVLNQQMRRLIFFMLGAGMIEVGEFVEGELAVAFSGTKHVLFGASAGGEVGERLQVLVARTRWRAVAEAAVKNFLESSVEHSGDHAILESLVKVAYWPELVFNPAGFDAALELAEGCC